MVKISKILAFLILIFHVHLTTTLPTHVLEERNLTMLLANRSGHDLKKRDSFDPLKLKKGLIISRPLDLPRQIALLGLAAACKRLKTFVAFCLCCEFNNGDVVLDTYREIQLSLWDRFRIWLDPSLPYRLDTPIRPEIPFQGPSIREMWREYQESEYYNVEMGSSSNSLLPIPDCPAIPDYNSRVIIPCLPHTVDDIVRPLDPSTSETCRFDPPGPPTSQASTSQCRIPYSKSQGPQQRRDQLLALNAPGFAEFLEMLSFVPATNTGIRGKESIYSISISDSRTQMILWDDYNIVRQRFAQLNDIKLYLETILRHARFLKLNLDELISGLSSIRRSELEDLIMYCSWDIKRKQSKNDELK
ncbi:hypothetical protein C2G38_2262032 [Gigaspora rosea]|uniref:Uncharacterized protein n=1 Tax=Gigaspora rosea TaxID=44941 RepID=A0A397VWR9_9GLOM|nr:hypothetical protein C2G38_2262032 [Gigaspora rosea]